MNQEQGQALLATASGLYVLLGPQGSLALAEMLCQRVAGAQLTFPPDPVTGLPRVLTAQEAQVVDGVALLARAAQAALTAVATTVKGEAPRIHLVNEGRG